VDLVGVMAVVISAVVEVAMVVVEDAKAKI
jgi:hypothetical protein